MEALKRLVGAEGRRKKLSEALWTSLYAARDSNPYLNQQKKHTKNSDD